MINEIYDVFISEYDKYDKCGKDLVADNYILTPGDYIKFTLKNTSGDLKIFHVDKDTDRTEEIYKYFVNRDYLSGLNVDKALDRKKVIHSNNMYSFYVKKENLDEIKGKLNNEIIDGYYRVLKNPETKYKKPKSMELYLQVEKKYGKPDIELINKIQNWIKGNIFKISKRDDVKLDKTYIKLFYDTDLGEYKKESERYFIPNIYNKTDYNVKINSKIYGLPDFNMGMNSKKPYLDNKTRKCRLPMLVDSQKIFMEKKLFDYLMNCASDGKNYIYAEQDEIESKKNREKDFRGYFLRLNKGKEVEITDCDSITNYKYKLRKVLKISPILKNGIGKDFKLIKGNLNNVGRLKDIINEVFLNKYLENNLFTDAKKIKLNDSKVKESLLKYRYGFYTWFYKGEELLVKDFWDKMSLELLCNSINQGTINKAVNQFNLRHALLDYFRDENGGDKMANTIKDVRKFVDEKINIKKDIEYKVEIDGDREYYFCIGQLLQYFYSLNKSNNKNYSFINPILNASGDKVIKEKLRRLFVKYDYAIIPSVKFRNMYYMILGYEPEKEINKDLIIAGFLCPNLIYKKSKDDSDGNDKKNDNINEEEN
ncbi:MAG: hypothetical protein LKE46_02615 [Clostridium sp.]|uniref:hypothetical protein n=1 Tax=Clostridium sp. TaxID=1506 RepID=UPI0025B95CA1|nr:hypothetical protein [Clostridium sp.]MCH3963140.1 hypothetical protein [Clostridium sp.]MCI1716397.1 hypothetical protein [Clostridium sp.]MCI1800737.1 hypothetical protein [Clostridium sp.]MCI1814608.1 hypothetical protein [Clostridium sp.]MCI1871518.1 hypothetical protein [Clostridium sp.]